MKFAYLIMAHDNQRQLLVLLKSLDYLENDIYIHIDKKNSQIEIDALAQVVKNANLYIYSKFRVYWADISQTRCQMFLLSEAIKQYHDYYHLLSGHDLPIKNHAEIEKFFNDNKGKEFVHFESDDYCLKEACTYFSFFWPIIQRIPMKRVKKWLNRLENISVKAQKRIGVCRKFYCGANWYSITHSLALDFCAHKGRMLRKVRWTKSSDEYILQSFVRMVSTTQYDFYQYTKKPEDYSGSVRLIDWNRGKPYVWKKSDYEEILNSDRMFARKFDENIDFEIIERISTAIMSK